MTFSMTFISVNLFVLFFLLPIFNMLTSAPASESGDHDTFESAVFIHKGFIMIKMSCRKLFSSQSLKVWCSIPRVDSRDNQARTILNCSHQL